MAWRRGPDKVLVQFFVGTKVPYHVNRAREHRGLPSLSAYYRDLIVDGLVRDLGLDRDEVESWMPKNWRENPGAVKIPVDSK